MIKSAFVTLDEDENRIVWWSGNLDFVLPGGIDVYVGSYDWHISKAQYDVPSKKMTYYLIPLYSGVNHG